MLNNRNVLDSSLTPWRATNAETVPITTAAEPAITVSLSMLTSNADWAVITQVDNTCHRLDRLWDKIHSVRCGITNGSYFIWGKQISFKVWDPENPTFPDFPPHQTFGSVLNAGGKFDPPILVPPGSEMFATFNISWAAGGVAFATSFECIAAWSGFSSKKDLSALGAVNSAKVAPVVL